MTHWTFTLTLINVMLTSVAGILGSFEGTCPSLQHMVQQSKCCSERHCDWKMTQFVKIISIRSSREKHGSVTNLRCFRQPLEPLTHSPFGFTMLCLLLRLIYFQIFYWPSHMRPCTLISPLPPTSLKLIKTCDWRAQQTVQE